MLRALRLLKPVLLLIDLALVAAAFRLGLALRHALPYGMQVSEDLTWLTPQVYGMAMLAWLVAFKVVGAHQPRYAEEGSAWRLLIIGDVIGMLLLLTGLFFAKIYDFSRLLVAYVMVLVLVLHLVRYLLTMSTLGRLFEPFARRVLLIGGGEIGEEMARRLANMPWGMHLVGVVAVDGALADYGRLGALEDVSKIVKDNQINEVFVALPAERHAMVEDVILRLQADPVRLHFVPDVLELTMVRARVLDFFGIPVVGLREPPIDETGRVAKRAFDLAVGMVAMLFAGPVLLLCALAIKIEDGGPVFFRQKRIGENGNPFFMLKFRSMVVNAEAKLKELGIDLSKLDKDNPVFKIQNDPRVTRVGRFLRRWSLDELPQLLNVLRGDMSLVGPRPEEEKVVAHYSFFHRKRLAVKPGMTGPMQVNGRGDLPLKQRLNLELAYIESWTLWSDLKIIAKTVPVVLFGKGAY